MKIHPDASNNIIKKSIDIYDKLEKLEPIILDPSNAKIDSYNTPEITDDMIEGTPIIDDGNGFSFIFEKIRYGLIDSNFLQFKIITENLWRAVRNKNPISYDYIENKFKEWIVFRKTKQSKINLIEYIKESFANDIGNYKILIPIPFTCIAKDFNFGKISFSTFKKEQIEEYLNSVDKDKSKLKEHILKNYSGYMVGIYEGKGERRYVKEEAYYNISVCLSLIRLFSPANQNAEMISAADAIMNNNFHTQNFITLNNDNRSFSYSSEIIDKGYYCIIPEEVIDKMLSDDFIGFKYLLSDNMSEYGKKLLDSITIYSKHTLKREISDKILYILSSLEMIFLKNDSESIQQNLSERIAFYIGKTPESRVKIIKIIKDTYQIRSRSVHHGKQNIESINRVNDFLILAWSVFKQLISDYNNFNNIEELINQLEYTKLS